MAAIKFGVWVKADLFCQDHLNKNFGNSIRAGIHQIKKNDNPLTCYSVGTRPEILMRLKMPFPVGYLESKWLNEMENVTIWKIMT